MFKTIQEIRKMPGFETLTKKQKANYIEFMHYILDDIPEDDDVQFIEVKPDPDNAPNHVLIEITHNGEQENYFSGPFLM